MSPMRDGQIPIGDSVNHEMRLKEIEERLGIQYDHASKEYAVSSNGILPDLAKRERYEKILYVVSAFVMIAMIGFSIYMLFGIEAS